MKAFARLALIILLPPALLFAQTPANQTAPSQASDKKSSEAQPAASGTQNSAATANSKESAAQGSEAAKPRVPGPYPVMSDKAKQRAHELYEYFVHGQSGQLYAAFSPEMKKQSPESKIATISKQVTTSLGSPGDVLSDSFLPSLVGPATLYSRTTNYSKAKVPVMVILGVDEKGQLTDIQVLPVQSPPRDEYTDYEDVAKLHLPFNGEWMVLQGGRTMYDNANVASEDNRYSVSFILVKDGMPFERDGKKNSDFYCYGQPVLAPAAGAVVQTGTLAQDHPPGRPTEVMSHGNYVVIAHGNGEFSMIPYLKGGSVKIRLGQHVKQGDVIGECGNSGSSPFPHVTYSLQNSRGFPLPKTMPAQFVDYAADGKPVPVGEPLRGQMVANQSKTTAVQTAGKP